MIRYAQRALICRYQRPLSIFNFSFRGIWRPCFVSAFYFFTDMDRLQALAFISKAEKHIVVIVPFDERIAYKIVFFSVRDNSIIGAKFKNPIQHRFVDADFYISLQSFQDWLKIQDWLFVFTRTICFLQHLQICHSGQAKQAIIIFAAAIPLKIPMTAFQYKLIWLNNPFTFAAVTVHICKGNQLVLLQSAFHDLQRLLYAPVPHPRIQVNADLIRPYLNISCVFGRNKALNLCQCVCESFSLHHSRKVGQPHQQRRKVIL